MKRFLIACFLACSSGILVSQTLVHRMFEADNTEAFNQIVSDPTLSDPDKVRAMTYVVHVVVNKKRAAQIIEAARASAALEALREIADRAEFSKADLLLLVDAIDWFLTNEGGLPANTILRKKLGGGPSDAEFLALDEQSRAKLCEEWRERIKTRR